MEIKLEVKNLSEDDNFVKNFQERLEGKDEGFKKKVLEKFSEVMFEDLTKRFASSPPTTTGGQVWGGATWYKLSESYLLQRPDRQSGKIYIDTGNLRKKLTSPNPELINKFDKDEYVFGTEVPYFERLQALRPIVFWHSEVVDKLSQAYIELLTEGKEENETSI